MLKQQTYSSEYIARLVLYIRCTARKYRIKQYYLFILYLSYIQYNRDKQAYMARYVIGWSLKDNSISKVLKDLIEFNLLVKVSNDTFCFTPYSIEVLNYIDSQLFNLESK